MPILRIIALSAVLSLLGFSAQAVTTTYQIDFTASNFSGGAPIDPVFGSFTVTFDPDGGGFEDVPVDAFSLNIPVDGTSLFRRSEGANVIDISGNSNRGIGDFTNDFELFVFNFFTGPQTGGFNYCVAAGCTSGPFVASQVSVSVSTVPLPPAAALLLAGLGGLMVLRRRGHPQMTA